MSILNHPSSADEIMLTLSSGGNTAKMQIFLVASTCFLYLVSAGLLSKGIGYFEQYQWNQIVGGDAAETGSGAGSYDIRKSVWHVNCCNPLINGGGTSWGIFNSLFGWTNSASVGQVVAYNLYWVLVMVSFASLRYYEKRGHWPFMKAKARSADSETVDSDSSSQDIAEAEKHHGNVEIARTESDGITRA